MAMNKAGDVHVHGSAGGPGMEPEKSGGHGLRGPDQEAEDGWGVPNVEARCSAEAVAVPMSPMIQRGRRTCSRRRCAAPIARRPSTPWIPLTAPWNAVPRALGLWKQPCHLPLACRLHIAHLRPLQHAARCVLLPDPHRQSVFHLRQSGTLGTKLLLNTSLQRVPRGRPPLHAVPDAEMPVLPVTSPPACRLPPWPSSCGKVRPLRWAPPPLRRAHRRCASGATSLATAPGTAFSR